MYKTDISKFPVQLLKCHKKVHYSRMIVERLLLVFTLLSTALASEVATGNNLLANELFRQLDTKDKNVVFSPFSAHIALSLAYEGAGGAVEETLREALHVGSKAEIAKEYQNLLSALARESNVTTNIANKIYVRPTAIVKQNFLDSVINNFYSEVGKVDFADKTNAAKEINDWVKTKTNAKIDKLIEESDLDELTRVILLNAVYFKGKWDSKMAFDVNKTKSEPFHISSTKQIDTPFMHKGGEYYWSQSRRLDAKLLVLPYADNRYSLVIMLPNKVDGIDEMEEKLVGVSLSSYLNDFEKGYFDVAIPKFKIEYKASLNEPLQKIGFEDIFATKANFSEMIAGNEKLSISKVVQKAYIEVNEEGTEAAASTGATFIQQSLIISPVFRVNHPFVFFITANLDGTEGSHRNDVVLFMGKVYSPQDK